MKKNDVIDGISSAQIDEIRTQMLKFAELQVRNPSVAEDLVQDSLLSALKNITQFKRQAAFKTWIFAILKNKIIDFLRIKDRFVLETDLLNNDEDETDNTFFDQTGHWKSEYYPTDWQINDGAVYSKQFWQIFEICLTHLPAKQGRVFMMKEYLELSTLEICENAEVSSENLHVLLYRARLQLQRCLSTKLGGNEK